MAQELADRRSVGVEGEVSREVLGGGCVERDLSRLHELHHLCRDDRLRAAGDAELAVGLHVVDAVRRAGGPAPRSIGGHHGGCDPPSAGHVGQDRLELRCHIFWDGVVAESGEGPGREGIGLLAGEADSCRDGAAALAIDGSDEGAVSLPSGIGAHPASKTTTANDITRRR